VVFEEWEGECWTGFRFVLFFSFFFFSYFFFFGILSRFGVFLSGLMAGSLFGISVGLFSTFSSLAVWIYFTFLSF
jgi:hypothetical protein